MSDRPELKSGLSGPPLDCTNACMDDLCNCSGNWRTLAYTRESVDAVVESYVVELKKLREAYDRLVHRLRLATPESLLAVTEEDLAHGDKLRAALDRGDIYEKAIREVHAVARARLAAIAAVNRTDVDHAAFDHIAGIMRRALVLEER